MTENYLVDSVPHGRKAKYCFIEFQYYYGTDDRKVSAIKITGHQPSRTVLLSLNGCVKFYRCNKLIR